MSLGDANQMIGVRAPCQRRWVPADAGTLLTLVNPTHPGTQRANAAVRFAFKVDNHTHVSQRYVWPAMTQTHGRVSPVDAATGHLTLPSYHFALVRVSVRLVCMGLETFIGLPLASPTGGGTVQTINFRLACRRNRA